MDSTPVELPDTERIIALRVLAPFLLTCLIAPLYGYASTAAPQSPSPLGGLTPKQQYQALTYTTPAYRREALRLVIQEANRVATELHLHESLPITTTNLLEAYISPPRMAQSIGTFGNVSTSNYTYCVSVANKFSFLVRRGLEREYKRLRAEYLLPTSQMNTNAALQQATQFLASVSMDVTALALECDVHIKAYTPEGKSGDHFVPVYWLYWTRKGREGDDPVADVELFEPTRTLHQLHVLNPEYILRRPLIVQNLDMLLSQTNGPSNLKGSESGRRT